MSDVEVAAVKTGMLPTRETIEETAAIMAERKVTNLVVDPVVRSTSGYDLIDASALRVLIEKLFPLSLIVTPNLQEAERITGLSIRTVNDIDAAGAAMLRMGARNVLIKGGHFIEAETPTGKATDRMYRADGGRDIFEADLIETTSTHGTGCTLAAAIAANLALGRGLGESVSIAK